MNNNKNVVVEKSYSFSLEVIEVYKQIIQDQKEYNLSAQLLRSATSIGANIEEALGASSKKDFIAKIQISYREARETHYWLRLLRDSKYIDSKTAENLILKCNELTKILSSIRLTAMRTNNS